MNKNYSYRNEGNYAVLVSGEGCVNCELMKSSLTSALEEDGRFQAFYLEPETDSEEIARINIDRVPCVVLFSNGKEIKRYYGFLPDEILLMWLETAI